MYSSGTNWLGKVFQVNISSRTRMEIHKHHCYYGTVIVGVLENANSRDYWLKPVIPLKLTMLPALPPVTFNADQFHVPKDWNTWISAEPTIKAQTRTYRCRIRFHNLQQLFARRCLRRLCSRFRWSWYPKHFKWAKSHQYASDTNGYLDPITRFTKRVGITLSLLSIRTLLWGYIHRTWSIKIPNCRIPVAVFPEYVTPETDAPVAVASVLIRRAWSLHGGESGHKTQHRTRNDYALVDNCIARNHYIGNNCTTRDGTLRSVSSPHLMRAEFDLQQRFHAHQNTCSFGR